MLTDDQVLILRKESRVKGLSYAHEHTTLFNVSFTTISRALRGETFAHLNDVEEPYVHNCKKLTDDQVILMRKKGREDNKVDVDYYVNLFDVNESTISKAVKGYSFKHLNKEHPPFVMVIKKEDLKNKARELCEQDVPYREIVKQLGVSKSSVSLWCKDLTEKKRELSPEKLKAAVVAKKRRDLTGEKLPRRERRNGPQTLTTEQVIKLRQVVRAEGRLNANHHASIYNVVASVIADAVRGRTFKYVDELEPPVTDKLKRPPRTARIITPSEELIKEALELKRGDNVKWSYRALSIFFKERTGRKYGQDYIKGLLIEHDPSIKDLKSPYRFVTRKPRAIKTPKLTTEKKLDRIDLIRSAVVRTVKPRKTSEQKKIEEQRRRAVFEEELRYQEWVEAGMPEKW